MEIDTGGCQPTRRLLGNRLRCFLGYVPMIGEVSSRSLPGATVATIRGLHIADFLDRVSAFAALTERADQAAALTERMEALDAEVARLRDTLFRHSFELHVLWRHSGLAAAAAVAARMPAARRAHLRLIGEDTEAPR